MDDDETSNPMNLDLNLGPEPDPEIGSELVTMSLEEWVQGPGTRTEEPFNTLRDAFRVRGLRRWRWRPQIDPWETDVISSELDQLVVNSGNETGLHAGEASGVPLDTSNEVTKTCEINALDLEDEGLGSKGDEEKGNGDAASFFDCNICLELSKDPVVTCCGHLFCWPCLYRWLHVHSEAKECPVCKGQVKMKNVTPIYGRRNMPCEPENDSTVKIPPRPQAQRVESLRQSLYRNAFTIPIDEMIMRLGHRFDLARDSATPEEPDSDNNRVERNNSLLNRVMTTRGIHREQNMPTDNEVDLTQSTAITPNPVQNRRLSSILFRRSQRHRTAALSFIPSAVSSAEGLDETNFHSNPIRRNLDQSPSVDDRDSQSSMVADINFESIATENGVEIDSLVSLSTSSSRRRYDSSRVSDVDSGDSRPPRRRRLN